MHPRNDIKANYSLREAIAVLFRQKNIIILSFLTLFSVVGIVTILLPNQYESKAKILVKNSRADVIVSPEQTNNMTFAGEVSEAQVNSEIELIQSRDLLEAVVKKTGLAREYAAKYSEESPVAIEKAIQQLEKKLSITPVKKANIIDISYSSNSASQSALVVHSLADLYLERHLQVHRVPGTEEFFKTQAAEYEQKLKEAQIVLLDFEAKNSIVSLNLQKEMGLKRVIEAETDWQATDTTRRETSQRIEKISQQLQSLDTRITTQRKLLPHQYSIERMNTMLVELQHKRTQLLTRFQPEDRLVKEVDQQITDTAAALNKVNQESSVEQTSDVNPLRQALELELAKAQAEFVAKQSRQDSLLKLVEEHRLKLSVLESAELKHVELGRRVKELKDNYDLFAKKRDEALITNALDKQKISNVSIVETPSTPGLPSSPNRKLYLLLGLFLAGVVGLGSGIGAEFLRDTIHTPGELEAISKYPVLATIPCRGLRSGSESDHLLLGPDENI